MLKVTKRDGRIEGYKPEKIVKSIQRAIDSSGEVIPPSIIKDINERVVKYVNLLVDKVEKISVDDIHGYVIFILNDLNKEIGRVYREYHEELSASRDDEMDLLLRVARLKMNDKDIVNENANKDSKTFSTKRDLMAGQIAKAEGLKILPKDVRDAHLRGEIHFHDLDYSPYLPYTNCCLPDIEGMLRDGFIMGNASIGTPKSIQTAVNQISQVLASVSSSQYGGTSIDRIDELLEPYAQMNYDKNLELAQEYNIPDPEKFAYERTVKNIYDAMQSLEYEVNTLYTSNG